MHTIPTRHHSRSFITLTIIYVGLACFISAAVGYQSIKHAETSNLFKIPFGVGQTAHSLLDHGNLNWLQGTGTTENSILFHSARMPVGSFYIALCAEVFGSSALIQTEVCKILLCLMLLFHSALLALSWSRRTWPVPFLGAAILFVPFLLPPVLADLANLQVEEAYSFGLLASAVALLIFARSGTRQWTSISYAIALGITISLIYLSKSSMLGVAIVLVVAGFLKLTTASSKLILVFIVVAAVLGWGIHQFRASGRFTVGTSLDGANLHKGNGGVFIRYYPPIPPDNLDNYEEELTEGKVFTNEWQYSDWHKQQAILFIKEHPREELIALRRKLYVALFSLRSYGSGPSSAPQAYSLFGLAIFRLLFWTTLLLAGYRILRKDDDARYASWLFLAVTASCIAPYLVGFVYIRHVSVLIFPSALFLLRLTSNSGHVPDHG